MESDDWFGGFQSNSTLCGLPVPLRASVIVGFTDESLAIVSMPVSDPVLVGSNINVRRSVCPGLRVTGRVTGDKEKLVPLTETDFTVTAIFPVDVSVTTSVVR